MVKNIDFSWILERRINGGVQEVTRGGIFKVPGSLISDTSRQNLSFGTECKTDFLKHGVYLIFICNRMAITEL